MKYPIGMVFNIWIRILMKFLMMWVISDHMRAAEKLFIMLLVMVVVDFLVRDEDTKTRKYISLLSRGN